MKGTIVLLIYFLQTCLSDISFVDFDFGEEDAEKYPWITLITNESSIIGYGSIIHERAVLTLAFMDPKPSLQFPYKVHADCYYDSNYFSKRRTKSHCSQIRTIQEYHIIENNIVYNENFAILILKKPFHLTNKINILQLTDNNKYYSMQCYIFSLRTLLNINTNKTARFFAPFPIEVYDGPHLYNYMGNIINFIVVDHGIPPRLESFVNYSINSFISFSGSPVICKKENDHDYWRVMALTNMELQRGSSELKFSSRTSDRVIRIDQNIKNTLMDIIEMAVNLGRNNHNNNNNDHHIKH